MKYYVIIGLLLVFLLSYSCKKAKVKSSAEFKMINITDRFLGPKEYPNLEVFSAYSVELDLRNSSDQPFKIYSNEGQLPNISILWINGSSGSYDNYDYFRWSGKFDTLNFNPGDTARVSLFKPRLKLQDSILFVPELILNNRRYVLEFLLRKNESETGYEVADSFSYALPLQDTIADYRKR